MDTENRSWDGLVSLLAEQLLARRLTLASAESCTGGWVSAVLTGTAGSSGWFAGGIVAYSSQVKQTLLGVSPGLLAAEGAVSESVALAMAEGVRSRLDTDMALAVTGIAGPGGGSVAVPVGTVCLAWVGPKDVQVVSSCHFAGDRQAVRAQAVSAALEGVRMILET